VPNPNEPALPLAGIRVLDLSRVLAGPLCSMVLGDLGADVIKVERPGKGDDTRQWGPPFVGSDAAYFLALNRNKRSVSIDLRTEEGVRDARRLADDSDVLIENFRPGLMEEFGLGYEELSATNPGLVWCSLTAFGSAGEAASRPGYDIIVQALCGLMSVTGEPGRPPAKVGVALLDVITGLYAAIGILAALGGKRETGKGTRVDVALFDASVAAMVNQAANTLLGGVVPEPMGTAHPNIVPYQAFSAQDRPFILAAGNDRLFDRTTDAIGRTELASDPRFATNAERVRNRDQLIPMLADAFSERPAAHWLRELQERSVPCAPILRMDEVFATPEGDALVQEIEDERGLLRLVADPIRLAGMMLPVRLPPPSVGEHNDELLGP
jgi:crotonobetainyl-CoA:carnitine CoA-transferase CaiB-like acyl-CoA transferase